MSHSPSPTQHPATQSHGIAEIVTSETFTTMARCFEHLPSTMFVYPDRQLACGNVLAFTRSAFCRLPSRIWELPEEYVFTANRGLPPVIPCNISVENVATRHVQIARYSVHELGSPVSCCRRWVQTVGQIFECHGEEFSPNCPYP